MTSRFRSKDHKLDELRALPLFVGLPSQSLRSIANAIEVLAVADETVLVETGAPARELFVVLDGFISIERDGELEDFLEPTRWSNPLPVLARQRSDHTLVADGGSRLLVLGTRELVTALDTVPGLARRMLVRLAEHNEIVPTFPPADASAWSMEPRDISH